ncbi:MAG TPA: hypothetical protein VHY35_09780 [Stellaceae bacterium]|nr:hypothetical protein [Stellaceae bacterium]
MVGADPAQVVETAAIGAHHVDDDDIGHHRGNSVDQIAPDRRTQDRRVSDLAEALLQNRRPFRAGIGKKNLKLTRQFRASCPAQPAEQT